MKADTLIIGYGNADRQDDGVGWHVLKNLAEKICCTIPEDPGAPIEIENEQVDLLFILQIFPELAETLSHYKRVCLLWRKDEKKAGFVPLLGFHAGRWEDQIAQT